MSRATEGKRKVTVNRDAIYGSRKGSQNAIPQNSRGAWHLPRFRIFRACTKICSWRGDRRPGLRWPTSRVRLRLLWILPVRLRAIWLLWAELVLRRHLYRRRPVVSRLLWATWLLRASRLLRPRWFLWPTWIQAWSRCSRTCLLWPRTGWRRIPCWLRTWRLCEGRLSRRRTQVGFAVNSELERPTACAVGRFVSHAGFQNDLHQPLHFGTSDIKRVGPAITPSSRSSMCPTGDLETTPLS